MAARRLPVSKTVERIIGALALMWAGWNRASHKTVKIESTDKKQLAVRAVDTDKTFGQASLDPDGKVFRWNAGMTALFDWSYDEMVGHTLERLVPDDKKFHSPIVEGIFRKHVYDWYARAAGVMLKKKDGSLVPVVVEVLDVNGDTGRFRRIEVHPLGLTDFDEDENAKTKASVKK